VHFTMVQQPVFYRGKVVTTMQDLTTLRFKNPAKNPVVFTLKQQVYKYVNKRVAKKSAAIITPTQFVKDDVAAYTHIPLDKITVTLEAGDAIPDSPTPLPYLQDKEFIMYVGRPTPHKNLERLIAAFQKLHTDHPNLRLVLTGKKDANYRRIEEMVTSKGVERVIFTDYVSEAELRWMYEHCAAYIFPSLSEGFGLPPLEAMAHGAPVVSSNATCLPEVNGPAAHYFDPYNIDDMAQKISEVISNPKLRETLTKSGFEQIKRYSWQRMSEQTLALYDQVLSNK
jgi:glycosyltransferase involved in cell wall biosynthesis